jgi:hypothetical protein
VIVALLLAAAIPAQPGSGPRAINWQIANCVRDRGAIVQTYGYEGTWQAVADFDDARAWWGILAERREVEGVVVTWNTAPTAAERRVVQGCVDRTLAVLP